MKIKNLKLITIFSFYSLFLLLNSNVARADQSVSATIPPRTSDFQFALSSDGQSSVQEETILTYQITYGAKQSAGFPTATTIVARWNGAIAPNNATILDYVNGSATNAYGGVAPVVDLQNKTITWTIPSLPQGTTDQTVTFQLRTNSNYTGSDSVNFTVQTGMSNQYVALPDQEVTQTYNYQTPPPGPTATPGPRPTLAAIITPTPTPTPTYAPSYNLDFTGISDTNTSIQIHMTHPSTIVLSYGTTPTKLQQSVSMNSFQTTSTLTIPDLKADTKYYFKFTSTDESGQTLTSDIFTFTTAKAIPPPTLDNNIITFSTNGSVSFSGTQQQSNNSAQGIILTNDSDYQISYALTNPTSVQSIEIVIINKVLGASTTTATSQLPTEIVIPMQRKSGNLYVADIKALRPGLYDVYIRIQDTSGHIIQKKITALKIMTRLTVYAQDTGLPLPDARIYFSYFDPATNSYRPLSSQLLGTITNPSYTDASGQIPITLPAGKYRIEESALFYDSQVADFTIGTGSNQNFPILYLKHDPFNVISLSASATHYLSDTWNKIIATLRGLSASIRIFNLIAFFALGSFIALCFLLFLLRSHIHPKHLPFFVLFHLDRLLNKHRQRYIYGSVVDDLGKPVSRAVVQIEDADTHTILQQTMTNKAGKFTSCSVEAVVIVTVSKEGYVPSDIILNDGTAIPDAGLTFMLVDRTIPHASPFSLLFTGLGNILGMLFEVTLVVTIILELLFFSAFGLNRTLPYFLLSLINISIWLFYLREHHDKIKMQS